MPLSPGTRVGQYEVLARLGAGGMGEVYRAHDTKLGREVALKVLPEGVATDPERLKRFEREAKSLAALNHPHIAQIYGFEDADPVRALVMELVPGDSLAARLERGPISLREALELARQIADGLEAAHDKGIIHRDLKPGNIQVTPDGQAKILDFGLAKALGPEGASATADAIDAPTITAGTRHGVILGTAAYMSPEQARGLPVDARADIWAFGGVLYEMLAGARAFPGATATDVLVAILEREPDWTVLPAATPPAIRALLQRCLRKDARQRLHHIADAKFTIEEAIAAPGSKDPGLHNQEGDPGLHLVGPSAVGSTHAGAAIAVPPPPRAVWRHPLPLGLALLALALGGALAWSITRSPAAAAREPQYLSLMLPPGQELVGAFVAVSPDGRGIVYAAAAEEGPPGPEGNVPRLYHRRLAEPAPRPLPNTEGGVALSFSPDGKWLGFLSPADRTVKKIALAGGGPKVLAEGVSVSDIGGGRWTADDCIVFGDLNGPLWQVPAAGGAPELAVPRSALDADELGMVSPVPVKAGFLFSANATPRPYRIVAWVNGHRRVLATQGGLPQLAGAGQLLFARRASATQADSGCRRVRPRPGGVGGRAGVRVLVRGSRRPHRLLNLAGRHPRVPRASREPGRDDLRVAGEERPPDAALAASASDSQRPRAPPVAGRPSPSLRPDRRAGESGRGRRFWPVARPESWSAARASGRPGATTDGASSTRSPRARTAMGSPGGLQTAVGPPSG